MWAAPPSLWGAYRGLGPKDDDVLCSEAVSVNDNNTEGVGCLLRCKRWSCELCQPWNRWQVIKKGRYGNPNVFMTLTCNPHNYDTPDQAARDMKRALVLLRRRIEKRYGIKNLPFMVVFERTKIGWPHMHILARAGWIDQSWLSTQMRELIDAPIVDIRKIQDRGRAAAYVSKYVGKDPHVFKGCKRWWRSHNYQEEVPDPQPKITFGARWHEVEKNWETFISDLRLFGAELVEEKPGWVHFRYRERGP